MNTGWVYSEHSEWDQNITKNDDKKSLGKYYSEQNTRNESLPGWKKKTKDFGIDIAKLKKWLLLCNFDMMTSVDRGQKHVLQRI